MGATINKENRIFFNHSFDKKRLKNLISWVFKQSGEAQALKIVDLLKEIGFRNATKAGISIGLHDLTTPIQKSWLISESQLAMNTTERDFAGARITATERSQRIIDTWHRASESLSKQVVDYFGVYDRFNPVYIMALSGARGNFSQVRQLIGMRGLMADQQGKIVNFPIRSNLREGLTLTEYFISCSGARKGLVDTALRTADTGYLTRRLVDVSHHVVVKRVRCNTDRGIAFKSLESYNKTLLPLKERLVGRVLAEDIFLKDDERFTSTCPKDMRSFVRSSCKAKLCMNPSRTCPKGIRAFVQQAAREIVAKKDQEISLELASKISLLRERVYLRSPLTCGFTHSVCQLCYGWSISQGTLVSLGDAVGVIAAQSIGEPGTQLTMRTFHTGGVFSGDLLQEIRAPHAGKIAFSKAFHGLLIRTAHGHIAFLSKTEGSLLLHLPDETMKKKNNSPTTIPIPAFTMLFVRQGERVENNQLLAEFSIRTKEGNQPIKTQQTVFAQLSGRVVEDCSGKVYTKSLKESAISFDSLESYALSLKEPIAGGTGSSDSASGKSSPLSMQSPTLHGVKTNGFHSAASTSKVPFTDPVTNGDRFMQSGALQERGLVQQSKGDSIYGHFSNGVSAPTRTQNKPKSVCFKWAVTSFSTYNGCISIKRSGNPRNLGSSGSLPAQSRALQSSDVYALTCPYKPCALYKYKASYRSSYKASYKYTYKAKLCKVLLKQNLVLLKQNLEICTAYALQARARARTCTANKAKLCTTKGNALGQGKGIANRGVCKSSQSLYKALHGRRFTNPGVKDTCKAELCPGFALQKPYKASYKYKYKALFCLPMPKFCFSKTKFCFSKTFTKLRFVRQGRYKSSICKELCTCKGRTKRSFVRRYKALLGMASKALTNLGFRKRRSELAKPMHRKLSPYLYIHKAKLSRKFCKPICVCKNPERACRPCFAKAKLRKSLRAEFLHLSRKRPFLSQILSLNIPHNVQTDRLQDVFEKKLAVVSPSSKRFAFFSVAKEKHTSKHKAQILSSNKIEDVENDAFKYIEPVKSGRLGFLTILSTRLGATFDYLSPIKMFTPALKRRNGLVALQPPFVQNLATKSSYRNSQYAHKYKASYKTIDNLLDSSYNKRTLKIEEKGETESKTGVDSSLSLPFSQDRKKEMSIQEGLTSSQGCLSNLTEKYIHPESIKETRFVLQTIAEYGDIVEEGYSHNNL